MEMKHIHLVGYVEKMVQVKVCKGDEETSTDKQVARELFN